MVPVHAESESSKQQPDAPQSKWSLPSLPSPTLPSQGQAASHFGASTIGAIGMGALLRTEWGRQQFQVMNRTVKAAKQFLEKKGYKVVKNESKKSSKKDKSEGGKRRTYRRRRR